MFAGLVFCADCGKSMVLYRTESIKRSQFHLKCYTYGKKGKNFCTPHQIRETDLKQVVLDDPRRVTRFARMKERQFAAYITAKNSAGLRQEINALQKEADPMQRRSDELSALFKRLYEDNVLGRITDEQFRRLSADYNAEQKTLDESIPVKMERLEKLKASAVNMDAFIQKAKSFKTIDALNSCVCSFSASRLANEPRNILTLLHRISASCIVISAWWTATWKRESSQCIWLLPLGTSMNLLKCWPDGPKAQRRTVSAARLYV